MNKDFESWHFFKKNINDKNNSICTQKELWTCSLGLNVGSEQDGRGDEFSRPVLILKSFNADTFWGIPITLQARVDPHYFKFNLGGLDQYANLSQLRLLSTKRLQRRITIMPDCLFQELLSAFLGIIPKNEIPLSGESL